MVVYGVIREADHCCEPEFMANDGVRAVVVAEVVMLAAGFS